MQYACVTISSSNDTDFDAQMTRELNLAKWEGYTFSIQFLPDVSTYLAHIVFTRDL